MDIDPHTLQQILERIHQQMRCPQCGNKVPVTFDCVRIVADDAMLLQLQCDECSAYIVLQASLKGLEHITSASPYEEDELINASSGLISNTDDVGKVRDALKEMGGEFSQFFQVKEEELEN